MPSVIKERRVLPCRSKLAVRIVAALHQHKLWPLERQQLGVLAVAVVSMTL